MANLPLENQTYLAGQSVNVAPPLAVPKLCFRLESAFLGLGGTVWVGKLGYQHNRVLSALDWHMARGCRKCQAQKGGERLELVQCTCTTEVECGDNMWLIIASRQRPGVSLAQL